MTSAVALECGDGRCVRENGGVDVNDPSLWEQHAEWWQREFTDGADPEYEEQILPLIDQHLAGSGGCSTSGVVRGRFSRRAVGLGAAVVGLDPTRAQIVVAKERGGGPALCACPSPTTCRADRGHSTRS